MEILSFKGLGNFSSKCGVTLIADHTVVATQLPDNEGTSVTNAWPFLADVIEKYFDLQKEVRWIEHYPANASRLETWDEVKLVKINGRYEMDTNGHPWRQLTEAEVAAL